MLPEMEALVVSCYQRMFQARFGRKCELAAADILNKRNMAMDITNAVERTDLILEQMYDCNPRPGVTYPQNDNEDALPPVA